MKLGTENTRSRNVFFLKVAAVIAVIVAVSLYFTARFRIAVDVQAHPCIDARMLLVDLHDTKPEKGALFAFAAPVTVEPVYKRGTRLIKWVKAGPGDAVAIDESENITVNGAAVGKGLPHLKEATQAQKAKFYGSKTLGEGEWWMMGDAPTSFDSRYWGTVPTRNIIGRAYVIY